MSARTVRFDDSLPIFAEAIAAELGADVLGNGVILRDVTGRLAFFSRRSLDEAILERASTRVRATLGKYARADRVIADPAAPGADTVLNDDAASRVVVGTHAVAVIDRRLVGADWLRTPSPVPQGPDRFVFASLKGGVGRSTALSVVAADLARRGKSVLVVDLDLEAPGLGALLLADDTLPEFGTLDYLVESNIESPEDTFLADLVGPSKVTAGGRVDVAPAFGRRSITNPADVLAKLGRAYLEVTRPDGTAATLFDQLRELVDRLAARVRYDAVLVDARAGLHETTAASVLGLGADVFLFGLDEPQTFQGYAALLASLARLIKPGDPMPEWVDRLTPVQAKAPADAEQRLVFEQQWQDMVISHGPIPAAMKRHGATEIPLPEGFKDVPWDESAPDEEVVPGELALLKPIAVLSDQRFVGFDPLRRRDQLDAEVYKASFGDLLGRVNTAIASENEGPP